MTGPVQGRCPLTPGKRVFRSRAAADRAAEEVSARVPVPVEAYRCPGCYRWHHRNADKQRLLHGTGTGSNAEPAPTPGPRASARAAYLDRLRESDPQRYREQKRRKRQRWKTNVKNRGRT